MKKLYDICKTYDIALCYLFGSQAETGSAILRGERRKISDAEADIDFAVLFKKPPENALTAYTALSLELQDLVAPYRADLLFLHEVDHLIQFEAIKGVCVYSINDEFREAFEERVMMFASDELEVFKLNEKDMFEAIENGYFEFEYQADRR